MCAFKRAWYTCPSSHLIDMNVGISVDSVAQAYLNQKRLDAEAKQLHTSANNFAKQTQQWMTLIEGFSNALKVNNSIHTCLNRSWTDVWAHRFDPSIVWFFRILCRRLAMWRTGQRVSRLTWLPSTKPSIWHTRRAEMSAARETFCSERIRTGMGGTTFLRSDFGSMHRAIDPISYPTLVLLII